MPLSVRLEKTAQAFQLNGQPIARGGEAAIYVVPGQPGLVAKVYHQPTADHAAKVATMIAAPPTDPMAGRGHVSIAWPTDRLLDAAAPRFLGYVMPRVDKVRPVLEFYNPASRLELCPLFHYGYLLRTARNLAAAVRAVHERGYVIGDVNESNILVSNMALVTLVDTDSFQVPGPQQVYRCPVGKPEYTPPELQGARFADFDRGPEHDAFALAILVFQLLMQGIHPFAGRYIDVGEPGGISERIAAGHWPYARGRRVPYAPNPHAPPFDTLPPRVQELMRRCFEDGHARSAIRPDASAWHQAFQESEKELVACPANPKQHVYPREQKACPWCLLARRQGRDLFPSAEDVQAGRVGPRAAAKAPAKAPEVLQAALAPAPMSGSHAHSRDAAPAATGSASGSGSVARTAPSAPRPSDLAPSAADTAVRSRDYPAATMRPSDIPPPSDIPANGSSPSAPRSRPRDIEPPAERPVLGLAQRLPRWAWVAAAAGGAVLLVVLLIVAFSGGGSPPAPPGPGPVVEGPKDKDKQPIVDPKEKEKQKEKEKEKEKDKGANPGPPTQIFPHGPSRFLCYLPAFDLHKGEWPITVGDIGNGKPIKVGGVLSPHGIGMHPGFGGPAAAASVKYRLNKEATLFKATVAVDDSTNWSWSPATFKLFGDGKELWASQEISSLKPHIRSQECKVLVEGVDVLELRVQAANGNKGVVAVWVEPRILRKFDSADAPKEEEVAKKQDPVPKGDWAKLDPELATLLRDTVQKKNHAPTDIVGFPAGEAFEEVNPEGGLLIGFEVGLGKFGGRGTIIQSLRPIFMTAKGEVRGEIHGNAGGEVVTVKAKKGYAVGKVSLTPKLFLDGMRVTFMRVDKRFLDPEDRYESESVGSFNPGPTVVGSGRDLIVGICGRCLQDKCRSLGLVFRGTK